MGKRLLIAAAVALYALGALAQQPIKLPPSGGNQRQTVIQQIGPVKVSVDYSSPHVHSPSGEDRRGKIWGKLVPYGMPNLGFGTCKECPWRGGANENTVFTTSHDIVVQGQKLAAGSYGVHFIPDPAEWTVIFSKNDSSWGSFTYDPAEDVLRVKAKPEKSEYREVLTYDFTERKNDHATMAMKWEELALPIEITVPNVSDLYIADIKNQLRNWQGFTSENWAAAAQYALNTKHNTDALKWAEIAAHGPSGIGTENFTTLMLLADANEANAKPTEAQALREKALADPAAKPIQLHLYGRSLLGRGKKEEALKVFETNAKRFPNQWPVNFGLARGYSAVGKYDEALKYAKAALDQVPDPGNKKVLQDSIEKLSQGKDIN